MFVLPATSKGVQQKSNFSVYSKHISDLRIAQSKAFMNVVTRVNATLNQITCFMQEG